MLKRGISVVFQLKQLLDGLYPGKTELIDLEGRCVMHLEGHHIDRYHILRLLGGGGMGDVYLAEDSRIGQQVAIKIIRSEPGAYPNASSTEEVTRLFYREAKAIVKLDHPHILPLFDYGEERIGDQLTTYYLVMPYRPEGSLAKWLGQRAQKELLSPHDVAHFVQQAADALQHAHERQIIHQDVKPSNFLIRERKETPGRPDLLLTDFGIARLMTTSAATSQTVHGTPTYMAPEQCLGQTVPASDQYALAIMAYELLTGRPPFFGGPMQVMFQQIHDSPQLPGNLNASLSKEVDEVLLRALAKQASERFTSISAFAAAFEKAVQNLSQPDHALSAPPDSSLTESTLLHPLASERTSAELAISEAEARTGTTRTVTLPDGQTIQVKVPAGVQDGYIIHLDSQDNPPTDDRRTPVRSLIIRIKQETGTLPQASSVLAQSTMMIARTDDPPSDTLIRPQQDPSDDKLPDAEPVPPADPPLTPVLQAARSEISSVDTVSTAVPTAVAPVSPPPAASRLRLPRWLLFVLPVLVVLLITGSFIVPLIMKPSLPAPSTRASSSSASSSATIIITPASKKLANTYSITAVTTTPAASMHQVAARFISAQTSPHSQTVPATGTATTPATHASGILTLYNYSTTTPVTLTAGTDLPNQQSVAVDMILDGTVTVPPATDPTNPPTGNVPAHVAQTGTIGNLPQVNTGSAGFYYCTDCSGNTVKGYEIENDAAFSGGKDAQTFTVVQQSDITGATNALATSNAPNPQPVLQGQIQPGDQVIGTPQCSPHAASDHQAGDQATSVTVTVSFTCTSEVYEQDMALSLAAKLLSDQAATEFGTGYSLVGKIATRQIQAVITNTSQGTIAVTIVAQGIWDFQFSTAQKQMLTSLAAGKTQQQAQSLLLAQAGVQRVTIQIPQSGNTLPTDVRQISIVVQQAS